MHVTVGFTVWTNAVHGVKQKDGLCWELVILHAVGKPLHGAVEHAATSKGVCCNVYILIMVAGSN